FDQAFLLDDLLHRQCGGAGDGVADIGMTVLECARAALELGYDPFVHHERADRLITSPEALGQSDHVRDNALLLKGETAATPPHAAHDLVEDQEDAMTIADRADLPEVAGRRRHGAKRCANHRFRDEPDYAPGPQLVDVLRKRPRHAQAIGFGG